MRSKGWTIPRWTIPRWTIVAAALAFSTAAFAQMDPNAPPPEEDPNTIVVPGHIERPTPIPPGDRRTVAERMEDISAWDRCVVRAQAVSDSDPTRYQADSPEELCRRSLGMAGRTAVPVTRD